MLRNNWRVKRREVTCIEKMAINLVASGISTCLVRIITSEFVMEKHEILTRIGRDLSKHSSFHRGTLITGFHLDAVELHFR